MSNFYPGTETCFNDLSSNGLNPNFFPRGTAQHLDINYNILPFLCDLLKATTDNNVSPLLTEPPPEFDLTPFTDFSGLTGVGDPRVSLGEVMTQTYIYFLPRVITQTEVRQAGGTQVIDNYICTADGTPIKISETVPVLLSLDLTGQKPYQYGAITIPPISSTYERLMELVQPEEVSCYVRNYMNSAKERHAQSFVDFINTYLNDFKVKSINVYEQFKYLSVELTKNVANTIETIYLKYYSDVANKVGCLLGVEKLNYYLGVSTPSNMNQAISNSSVIPNYKLLMEDEKEAIKFKNLVLSNYKSTPESEYTTILSNSAKTIEFFNSFARTLATNQLSSVDVIPC
jgi:hypothetical protein